MPFISTPSASSVSALDRTPAQPRQLSAKPRKRRQALTLLLLPLALCACSTLTGASETPAPKEPARLEISIEAGADLNLDLKGRGTPLLLRVYELKSDIAFQEADFFALQNADKTTLGADILAVDQFILRPGETRQITRKSKPETTAIGIFAGYRDLPAATWRVVHKLPPAADASWYRMVLPAHKARLRVDLQANTLRLTDEEAGEAKMQHANETLKGLQEPAAEQVTTLPAVPGQETYDSFRRKR